MDSEEPMDLETPRPKDPSTDDTVCVDLSQQPYQSPHGQQISMAEYKKQSGSYTQQAVKDLKASPEFKMYTQRCLSCGASWYDGQWGKECQECGGYAMKQPCPLCSGQCGRMWTRSVDMSHRTHAAHWDGECGSSFEQQATFMIRTFIQNEEELADALEDLHTQS